MARQTILVTGGTGFVGRALIRHLVEEGYTVRTMVQPSRSTPNLPKGVPIEVAISSITDERSLRTALSGVQTIFHTVGGEWKGVRTDLSRTEIAGTRLLLEAAEDLGIERILYLSHLGADRASAYTVLKAKGISEEFIRKSSVDHTIIRSALAYGPYDHFTTDLARLISLSPFFFPIPGEGRSLLQPVWINDLVTCLVWALDKPETVNRTYEIGGPEFLPLHEIIQMVMERIGTHRRLLPLPPPYMRGAAVFLDYVLPRLPQSVYWVDYLAANRTTEIDSISRQFGLLPVRMSHHLDHLEGANWRSLAFRTLLRGRGG